MAVQTDPPKSPPPAISVSLSPTVASLPVWQTQQFTVTIQNDTQNKGVTWSLTQSGNSCTPACGSVSYYRGRVTYDAPANIPNPTSVTLTATSVADNSKSASLTISIKELLAMPLRR